MLLEKGERACKNWTKHKFAKFGYWFVVLLLKYVNCVRESLKGPPLLDLGHVSQNVPFLKEHAGFTRKWLCCKTLCIRGRVTESLIVNISK